MKNEHMFGAVGLQGVDEYKTYSLEKLKILNFFLHDIIQCLEVLKEKIIFNKFGLECSDFQAFIY